MAGVSGAGKWIRREGERERGEMDARGREMDPGREGDGFEGGWIRGEG